MSQFRLNRRAELAGCIMAVSGNGERVLRGPVGAIACKGTGKMCKQYVRGPAGRSRARRSVAPMHSRSASFPSLPQCLRILFHGLRGSGAMVELAAAWEAASFAGRREADCMLRRSGAIGWARAQPRKRRNHCCAGRGFLDGRSTLLRAILKRLTLLLCSPCIPKIDHLSCSCCGPRAFLPPPRPDRLCNL
jgi:hypothetical protein